MDLVGQVVGERYRVLRSLGSGAMGVLFEVENTKIGRRFALKTLTSELARKPDSLARFRREAEIIARLNHPNVVAIVDWDTLPDGAPFYVMELLEGEDLGERVARAPLALDEFGTIAAQAMAAVAEAHRHGVLHRDLKPANLFLCRVPQSIHVKVLDFGLARAGGVPAITAYDKPMWIGTPAYMSPEQIVGEAEPGQKADVWAMGAVLFEILTGRQAYPGPLDQVIAEIRKGDPPRVRALRPDVPPLLADAIESAMSRDPERRITLIDDLAARVKGALASAPTMASTIPPVNNPSTIPPSDGPPPELSALVAAPPPPPPQMPPMPSPMKVVDSAADTLASPRAQRRRVRAWVWVAFASALVAVASAVVAVVALSEGDGDKPAAAGEPAARGGALDAAPVTAAAKPVTPVVAPPQPGPGTSPAPDAAPRAEGPAAHVPDPVRPPAEKPASVSPEDAKVADLIRQGTTQTNLGNFQRAIEAYKQAYTLKPSPQLLSSIGDDYRQAGDCKNAGFFYKRYLANRPDATDKKQVEAIIRSLDAECGAPAPAPASTPSGIKDPFASPGKKEPKPPRKPKKAHKEDAPVSPYEGLD